MMNLSDTISAFRCCVQIPPDCANCPEQGPGFGIECRKDVKASVFHWLKAQEPRVMTLEEVRDSLKTPFWKEVKSRQKDLYQGWVLAYDVQTGMGITGARLGMSEPSGRVVWYKLEDYGRTWRCWTTRPTDEQREAASWR